MELCPACRKLLYRTDPCKGSGECGRTDGGSKSMAARKDEQGAGDVSQIGVLAPMADRAPTTSHPTTDMGIAGIKPSTSIAKRGRPRTGFDKKAYDRLKAADVRARKKNGQPS